MTPVHFLALWRAETEKLLSRVSARLGLAVAGLIGIGAPIAVLLLYFWMFNFLSAQAPAGQAPEWRPIPAGDALWWALYLRNFFVLPAFLIMIMSLSFASEFQARTLREDLLRPVPRWSVLLAKWSAMVTWIFVGLALTWAPAAFMGALFYRGEGEVLPVTLGFLATGLSDVALGSIVMAIAVLTRSVAGTIVGVFLFYVLSYAAHAALFVAGMIPVTPKPARDLIASALPWLPSTAFSAWRGFEEMGGWNWPGLAGLGVLTAFSMIVALILFERMDVP